MENEAGLPGLIYWKKKAGDPLNTQEEELWSRWERAQQQKTVSVHDILGELYRRAVKRRYAKANVLRFQIAFDEKYGIPAARKNPVKVVRIQRLVRWAAVGVLISLCIISVMRMFMQRSNKEEKVVMDIPSLQPVHLSRKSAIMLISDDNTRIPIDLDRPDHLIIKEGRMQVMLQDDSIRFLSNANYPIETQGYHTIVVPAGKQLWVVLPDGTRTCLNPNSSIRIPLDFAKDARQVVMTGDGFFRVASRKDMPFTVYTAGLAVAAKGTHFNIDTRSIHAYQVVTLFNGHISIIKNGNTLEVSSSKLIQITDDTFQKLTGNQLINKVAAREKSDFDYHQVAVGQLIDDVADWYGLTITNRDAVMRMTNTINFEGVPRSWSVEEVLNVIGELGKVRFTLEQDELSVIRLK